LIPQIVFAIKPSPWQSAIGETYDLSKKPWFNFAKQTTSTQLVGPVIEQAGQNMKSSKGIWRTINDNIQTRGKTHKGIAAGPGNMVENAGRQLRGEKGKPKK